MNPLLPHRRDDTIALLLADDWIDEDTAADRYRHATGGDLTDWYPVADRLVERGYLTRRPATMVAGLPAYTEVTATCAGAWFSRSVAEPWRPEPDPASVAVRAVLRVTFDTLMDTVRGADAPGPHMAALADDFRRWAASHAPGASLPAAVDAYSAAIAAGEVAR